MFKNRGPRKITLKYKGVCADCTGPLQQGQSAYFEYKSNSPTGKSRVWHVECYEKILEAQAGSQRAHSVGGGEGQEGEERQGPQVQGTPESAPEASNSAASEEGPQGSQEEGGQMEKPLISDMVCQMLYDEEKLARHLHREDVYKVLHRGYSPWGISQLNKSSLIRELVERTTREKIAETQNGFHPYGLVLADDCLRKMLKLPPRPDTSQMSAEQAQAAVAKAEEALGNALEEAEQALEMAAEAEKRAQEAEGKVVRIETPEGQTINLTDRHFKFQDLAQLVSAGVPVLVVGPAGGGKTEACRSLAKDLGQEFMPLSLGPQTTQASLFGYTDAQGNYVRTPFREAFENGGLILLDEFDRCNERVSVTLNAAIAQRYCAFPDGTVHAHDKCVIVAAANTAGHGADRQYVSARQQDAATLDRFAVLDWPYDERFETQITLAQGLEESEALAWLNKVRDVREAVQRLAMRYLVSPRASIQGAKLIASGATRELAEDTILFRGWKPEDRNKVES